MKTILQQEQIDRLHEFGLDAVRLTDLLRILPKKIIAKKATYLLAFGVFTRPDNWYVKYKHERTNTTLYDLWSIKGELIDAIYEILLKIKGKRYKITEL